MIGAKDNWGRDIIKYKCVVLDGKSFDYYWNSICLQEKMNDLEIDCIISTHSNWSMLDGKTVRPLRTLSTLKFDYLIICDTLSFVTLAQDISDSYGIPITKIISAKPFLIPNFAFRKYVEIHSNPPTIICDNCWGAFTYNQLGLQFTSPFILMSILPNDYLKIAKRPKYYLSQKLKCVKEGDAHSCPIGALGDVTLKLQHYKTFADAESSWNKRIKRVNWNNLVFVMMCESYEVALEFSNLPHAKKYGFSNNNYDLPSIIYQDEWAVDNNLYYYDFWRLHNDQAEYTSINSSSYDILNLLLGQDCIRRKYNGDSPTLDFVESKSLKSSGREVIHYINMLANSSNAEHVKLAVKEALNYANRSNSVVRNNYLSLLERSGVNYSDKIMSELIYSRIVEFKEYVWLSKFNATSHLEKYLTVDQLEKLIHLSIPSDYDSSIILILDYLYRNGGNLQLINAKLDEMNLRGNSQAQSFKTNVLAESYDSLVIRCGNNMDDVSCKNQLETLLMNPSEHNIALAYKLANEYHDKIPSAAYYLSMMYFKGVYVEKNINEAIRFAVVASELSSEYDNHFLHLIKYKHYVNSVVIPERIAIALNQSKHDLVINIENSASANIVSKVYFIEYGRKITKFTPENKIVIKKPNYGKYCAYMIVSSGNDLHVLSTEFVQLLPKITPNVDKSAVVPLIPNYYSLKEPNCDICFINRSFETELGSQLPEYSFRSSLGGTIITNGKIFSCDNKIALLSGAFISGEHVIWGMKDISELSKLKGDNLGNYCSFIFDDKSLNISTDYFGMCKIYYYVRDKLVVISNRLHLLLYVLKNIGEKLQLDDELMHSYLLFHSVLTDQPYTHDMVVKGVKVLPVGKQLEYQGNELHFHNGELSNVLEKPRCSEEEYRALLDEAKFEIENNINAMHSCPEFDRYIFDLSGGIDSRLMFSGLSNTIKSCDKIFSYGTKDEVMCSSIMVNDFGCSYDTYLKRIRTYTKSGQPCGISYADYLKLLTSINLGGFDAGCIYKSIRRLPKTIHFVGGCGELYRPYMTTNAFSNALNKTPRELALDFCSNMSLTPLMGLNNAAGERFKTELTKTMQSMPGHNNDQKCENLYLFFGNRYHFEDTFTMSFSTPDWIVIMSKKAHEAFYRTFESNKDHQKHMMTLISHINSKVGQYRYNNDYYNDEYKKFMISAGAPDQIINSTIHDAYYEAYAKSATQEYSYPGLVGEQAFDSTDILDYIYNHLKQLVNYMVADSDYSPHILPVYPQLSEFIETWDRKLEQKVHELLSIYRKISSMYTILHLIYKGVKIPLSYLENAPLICEPKDN